ncbi:NAD(P)/FAD-dependent oxidoreductase [Halomonas sp. GD1P12]|uniref:NAD(P)/FAD-dependent oxidoreductase n=1 Tax=Halomonas sp. GD1P12 TaxID=2982691 RepID=UPI0021E3A7B3|nr:FAD-dependent oxidoreductase [Halomonas sp. GD1P12]UYG00759.1 FAD-dependent oxidoreductase [Halomonas sp. GD1P12]
MRSFTYPDACRDEKRLDRESLHLVIVGNGMACHRLLEALVKAPGRPARITVIGEEPVPAYNRILLSPLLSGETSRDGITLRDARWYADNAITLRLNERVLAIDTAARHIDTDRGRLAFDTLVLATGSRPTLPDIPGIELDGVHTFRNLSDAGALDAIARRGGKSVVIGGGLLGLEAAEGLRKRGGDALKVSVLHRSTWLMNRQLDAEAGGLLHAVLARRGLDVHTGASIVAIESDGQGRVAGVTLEDGRTLEATSVIVAAGVTPNRELGLRAGLDCERAILVDHHLCTSHPAIFALGECCQFQSHTFGLVEPIWRQVETLAQVLSGAPITPYLEAPTATRLKISGIDLYAFGPVEPSDAHDTLYYCDPEANEYRRLLLKNGRIEGAVLFGDTAQGPWYFDQALKAADLSTARPALVFGQADVETLLAADIAHPSPTQEAA